MKRIVISTVIFLSISSAYAQKKEWGGEGELESVEIEIVKERQITLPKANRNFEKIPPRPSDPIKPPITYDFRAFNFQTPQISSPVKPLKLKQEGQSKLYGNYVSAGFGNYASPYLEAFVNSTRDKNKLVGAHAYLNSSARGPVDGKNSASGTYGLSVYGQSFSNVLSLSGNAGFENRSTHFYGYQPGTNVDASAIKQAYNVFKLGGEIANAKNSDFSYKLGAGFSYLADKYSARETEVDFDLNSYYRIDDDHRIRIKAGYYLISRKDVAVEAKPRNLFQVNSAYEFVPVEDLRLSAGATLAVENDSIDSKSVHLYPDFKATYPLSPSVDVVGALTGGMDKVSLQSLSNENMWLAPNVPVFHTNRAYDLQFGLNARLGNKISASTGLSFANLKDWYFFVNDPADQAQFQVAYDRGGTKRTNLFASISYAKAEEIKLMLRGDLYGYTTDHLAEAYHRPTYRLMANASYNIYQKLIFKMDMIAQGGMKALDPVTAKTVTVSPAFDLNLRGEYLFSESFSFFLQFNNLTANKYPVFLNYPVRGFQVMGGITWSF